MIQRRIFFAFKYPIQHWPVGRTTGHRGVNGRVDGTRCVSAAKCTKAQVIVPRNHGKPAIRFIKIIVVDHHACITVVIADIIVNYKVADNLPYIHNRCNVLVIGQLFQGLNQSFLVGFGNMGLGVVPDV